MKLSKKRLFTAQVEAWSAVVGVLASCFIGYDLLKDLIPLDFHVILLIMTAYITALIFTLMKKNESIMSDILFGFTVYLATAFIYVFISSFDSPTHDGILGRLSSTLVFLLAGFPIVILLSLPAIATSITLIRSYRHFKIKGKFS